MSGPSLPAAPKPPAPPNPQAAADNVAKQAAAMAPRQGFGSTILTAGKNTSTGQTALKTLLGS